MKFFKKPPQAGTGHDQISAYQTNFASFKQRGFLARKYFPALGRG